jgi:sugar phosphate isomerase/epimerase
MNHSDIRIGTLANMNGAANYIKQILPHGFESFQLTNWKYIGDLNVSETAKQVKEVIAGKAVISSIGLFGNILTDEQSRKDYARTIDACKDFGCDVVIGFAGAFDGKPVADAMPEFLKVWKELAKRAQDQGVRIGFENCDMGGWNHSAAWNVMHAPTYWDIAFSELPDNVGLCWEPAHQLVSLIDPLPQLRKYVKKVWHVHGKDATVFWDVIRTKGLRGGEPYVYHRHPGFGDTNWTDIISILRLNDFKGSIDIEGWHDPVYKKDLEMTGQVHSMNYLKQCRGGPYIANPTK